MYRSRRIALLALLALPLALGGCEEDAHGVAGLRQVFGTTGLGPCEFSYPRAAAIRPDGGLYVVDKAGRIQCCDAAGQFLFDWHMPKFKAGKPTGLGVDAAGRIYAADTHYARVTVFNADGELLEMHGSKGEGPGQFIMPTDVEVSPDGHIYVSEYGGNDRVSKFTLRLRRLS
jgi:DNA-binding beta-propeller fold protein YncE